jgi:transcriptional regulator with XRE-family HTH domain
MSEFARTLSDLAKLCGKSQYQVAELSGLDPTFVRRLFNGEKRASHLTIIRLTIALVMDPKLAREHPDRVPFILNALTEAQLSDAIAELPESRKRNRWAC